MAADKAILRITRVSLSAAWHVPTKSIEADTAKDVRDIQTGSDLSIAVALQDADVRHVRAIIIGPPETPYEFGFFEFNVKFGKEYPTVPPHVQAITTNGGRTRFNPNIYAEGKVCLSILGTWRGEKGEEWSSAQGLESILWSIQSLMSSNPYENEPGFESTSGRDKDNKEPDAYKAKIHHETLRIAVIKKLEEYLGIQGPIEQDNSMAFGEDELEEPWDPFKDLCKRRFLWYYDAYQQSIVDARKARGPLVKDGVKFHLTAFEAPGNGMEGSYHYSNLELRLQAIHQALERESASWEVLGRREFERENPIALSFQNNFKAIQQRFQNSDTPLDLELVDKNPFAWRLILFGRPMTNLEGGIFKVKLVFHQDFPQIWPRVICETPLFHHRISSKGTLCYLPTNGSEISSHIQAIILAIEEESPRHDPRTLVNPEASRLLWGTPEEKKQYNRKLRRSAQESSEF